MRQIFIEVKGRDCEIPIQLHNENQQESEYDQLHEGFLIFAQTDQYLKNKLDTHYPSFTYEISTPLPNGGYKKRRVQVIAAHKKLPSNVEVFQLQMVAKNSPVKSAPITENCPRAVETAIPMMEILEILPAQMDMQVAFAETFEVVQNAEVQEPSRDLQDVSNEVQLTNEEQLKLFAGATAQKKKKSGSRLDATVLQLEDINPPKFSEFVQSILSKGLLAANTTPFIRELGDHLRSLKSDPRKADIEVYVTYLLMNIREVDSAMKIDGEDIGNWLAKMLLNNVRNTKYRKQLVAAECVPVDDARRGTLNFYKKTSRPTPAEPVAGPSTSTACEERALASNKQKERKRKSDESSGVTENDYMALLKDKNPNSALVISKLALFTKERRESLMNFDKIVDILKAWPAYSLPEVIEEEFFLCGPVSREKFEENFGALISQLEKKYSVECQDEGSKVELLRRAEMELRLSYTFKHPEAFCIEQLGDIQAPNLPKTIKATAISSVSYVASDKSITRVYILGERKQILMSENPSALQVMTLLLGAYYSYHREYPTFYRNLFDFLEIKMLDNTPKRLSFKVKDLLNNLNNFTE